MRMIKGVTGAIVAFLLGCGWVTALPTSAVAQDKIVKLTSLEWPPFAGEKLPDGGANTAVIRAAYEAMGYQVSVDYLPWNRAIQLVRSDRSYAGYYPEYDSEVVRSEFLLSESLGTSPVVFWHRVDKKIDWTSLQDLTSYTIGVVDGYANSPEFDKMMAEKKLIVDASGDDATNLRKLLAQRVDVAVLDKNVGNYFLAHDEEFKKAAGQVTYNPKILDDKGLYIAFRKDELGQKMNQILTEGLKRIDVKMIMDKNLKTAH